MVVYIFSFWRKSLCLLEKNVWSSCSFFFFVDCWDFEKLIFFPSSFSTPFSTVMSRSRNFYWFCLFISIFFFFYSCMPIVEFSSILFSLPPFFFFFFRLRNFTRSTVKIEIFFQSLVASGLIAESTLLRNEERSEILRELRPDSSRFLSHFWKEIRAE